MKSIKNMMYGIIILFLLAVATLVIANKFEIFGIRVLVVQSGSMEPNIGKNSVVVIAPATKIQKNDVITFRHSGRSYVLVTHRVQSVEKNAYVTKGDANEEADGEKVQARDVIGKVSLAIPFVGAIISFAQTTPGFIALIVIPAVVIVYSELLSLKRQLSEYLYKRRRNRVLRQA